MVPLLVRFSCRPTESIAESIESLFVLSKILAVPNLSPASSPSAPFIPLGKETRSSTFDEISNSNREIKVVE